MVEKQADRQTEKRGEQASQSPARREQRPARRGAAAAQEVKRNPKSENQVIRYFQDTGDELRKVAWPSREEVIRLSLIVLVSMVITSIALGSLDWLFQFLQSLLV